MGNREPLAIERIILFVATRIPSSLSRNEPHGRHPQGIITVGDLVAILDSFAIYRRTERIRASLSGHRSSRSKEKKRKREKETETKSPNTKKRRTRDGGVGKGRTWLWTNSRREDASEGEKSR